MARATHSSDSNGGSPGGREAESYIKDVELLRVLVSRKGTHVDAQWAIHSRLKQDLLPQEWQEVTDIMAKVTGIVGTRFSQVLTQAYPEPPSNA
jgi:hypothetical protein